VPVSLFLFRRKCISRYRRHQFFFFREVVCWYSSMKKFKIESYKFCALCTLKSYLINLFPVELCFVVRVMSSCHICWLWLGDSLFPDISFLFTSLLVFLLFKNFDKKLSCLIEVLVLWGIFFWRSFIEEMIPRKVKGRAVRSCIVWKAVSERNFPESSIKCPTFAAFATRIFAVQRSCSQFKNTGCGREGSERRLKLR